jgi:hypothetical protein
MLTEFDKMQMPGEQQLLPQGRLPRLTMKRLPRHLQSLNQSDDDGARPSYKKRNGSGRRKRL